MNQREKQHSGMLYDPSDPEIMAEQMLLLDTLREYNEIPHVDMARRENKLREMFAEIGEGCYVEPPSTPISPESMSISEEMSTPTLT